MNWVQRYSGKVTTTYGDNLDYPGEESTANPIIDRMVSGVKKGKGLLYIIAGAPGSGKTYHRLNGTYGTPDKSSSVHIDADEIKPQMPEAQRLLKLNDPDWASKVHQESRVIADLALQRSLREHKDIVYDSTGQFINRLGTLRAAKDRGYKVVAHYNVAPENVLEANRIKRQETDARRYPSSLVKGIMDFNRDVIPQVANFADEFHLWDTSNGTPRLLASKKSGGSLTIHHPDAHKHANFDRMDT